MAAPIASQVLGEVLPYLEVAKKEQGELGTVIVPNVTGMSLSEAKKVLKENSLEYDVKSSNEEYDIKNAVISDQLPKQGIAIKTGTKIIIYVD